MSVTATHFILAMVVVLSSYLYLKHCQRARSRYERYDPAEWNGKAIDVTKLKPAVENARRNYPTAQKSSRNIFFHRGLLGLARRTVTRLAYFQNRVPKEDGSHAERD
jgi:hypothetical protein